jgi:hypothetical protein
VLAISRAPGRANVVGERSVQDLLAEHGGELRGELLTRRVGACDARRPADEFITATEDTERGLSDVVGRDERQLVSGHRVGQDQLAVRVTVRALPDKERLVVESLLGQILANADAPTRSRVAGGLLMLYVQPGTHSSDPIATIDEYGNLAWRQQTTLWGDALSRLAPSPRPPTGPTAPSRHRCHPQRIAHRPHRHFRA